MSLLLPLILAATLPLNDLGPAEYRYGYIGGLWAEGSNVMPADHLAAGLQHASAIVPRDRNGNPSANGKIVFLAIGSANAALTFDALKERTANDPRIAPSVVMLTAAKAGVDARTWGASWQSNYSRVKSSVLAPAGVTEEQVQAVWLQLSTEYPDPPLPIQSADAYTLKGWFAESLRALKERYPNLQVAYLSSREYGGYAKTNWNPEPYAYESGLSVRWTILGQIEFMRTGFFWDTRVGTLDHSRNAPWISWGPYFWAEGETPRSDGLTWSESDFGPTGDLLSEQGANKTSGMLLDFLLREPTASWFRSGVEIPVPQRRVRPARH